MIPKDRLEAIYDLHPILHVNEAEALAFSGCREIQPAIEYLYQRTGQLVIVTLGEKGAVAYDGNWYEADGFPTEVVDTVGAGDSHVGAFISARLEGLDMTQALRFANKVSSQIVASKGVHLTKEQQEALRTELKQNKKRVGQKSVIR